MGHPEGHSVISWGEVHPSLPQNQEGLLGDFVEDIQRGNLFSAGVEEYLIHALTPQIKGWSLFLHSLEGYLGYLQSNQKWVPQLEDWGGGFFSSGSLGGFLSVRGMVPTESWE